MQMDRLQTSKIELEHRLMRDIHELQEQLQTALQSKAAADIQQAHVKARAVAGIASC